MQMWDLKDHCTLGFHLSVISNVFKKTRCEQQSNSCVQTTVAALGGGVGGMEGYVTDTDSPDRDTLAGWGMSGNDSNITTVSNSTR